MAQAGYGRWFALALMLTGGVSLAAHDLSQSASTIRIDGSTVTADLSINLLTFSGVDANGDGRVSYEELDRNVESVFSAVKAHYHLRADGDPTTIVANKYDIVEDHVLHISLRYGFPTRVTQLEVTSTIGQLAGPDHQHVVTAVVDGSTHRAMLTAAQPSTVFYAGGPSPSRLVMLAAAAGVLLILGLLRIRSRRAA